MESQNELELTFVIEEDTEAGGFTSLCLELNIASEGETIDQAVEKLKEAILLYLDYAIESGHYEELVPRPVPNYVRSRLKKRKTTVKSSKFNLFDIFNSRDLGPRSGTQLLHV